MKAKCSEKRTVYFEFVLLYIPFVFRFIFLVKVLSLQMRKQKFLAIRRTCQSKNGPAEIWKFEEKYFYSSLKLLYAFFLPSLSQVVRVTGRPQGKEKTVSVKILRT